MSGFRNYINLDGRNSSKIYESYIFFFFFSASGDNDIFGQQLLRVGLQQGRIPEAVRELLGASVRAVHGGGVADEAAHLPPASGAGGVFSHERAAQPDTDGAPAAGSYV